jgi:hypothetical protein
MEGNDIDDLILWIDELIKYRGKHLTTFKWSENQEELDHQEHILWFFDIIFEHLLSVQALTKGDRFPRYAHTLIVISRSMLEGTAILSWLCEGARKDLISKADLVKDYIKFKNLVEAKNEINLVYELTEDDKNFIDNQRRFLKENNDQTRLKAIEKISNGDVYREFYRAFKKRLSIDELIDKLGKRLEIRKQLDGVYDRCSEIAHFNPAALVRYMIREPDNLFFDSGNIELICASLKIAALCASFAIDITAAAFKVDVSNFELLK